jgi:hypothetical protein
LGSKRLGKIVERAAKGFVEAAAALHEIRERKLYRGKFKRFEDYCQSVHKISRQYANKLIKAGKIRIEMETIVSKLGLPAPANEGQLRELGRLSDPGERGQAYIEAVEISSDEERLVTARDIRTAVERRRETGQADQTQRPSPTMRIHRAQEVLGKLEIALARGQNPARLVKELRKLLDG